MLFKKKHTFNGSMSFGVKVLQLLGYGWTDSSSKNSIKTRLVVQIAMYFLWFSPPALAYSLRQRQDHLELVLKGFFEALAIIGVAIRLCLFAKDGTILRQIFNEVQQTLLEISVDCSSNVRTVLNHLEKSADKFSKGYTIVVLVQCLLYGPLQVIISTVQYFTTGQMPTIAVIQADFVFFNHYLYFWSWLLVMIVSVVITNVTVLNMATTESFYWNLIHHVSCLFKIVRQKISELDDVKDKYEFKEQLSVIVEIHEVAFRSCRNLEQGLFVLLGFLYTTCIEQLCYLLFIFTIIRDDLSLLVMMAVAVQYTVFLIFAFSMLGTELIEASSSIADEVYKLRWYERTPDERRLLLIIQMRSQIEASVTAGKFFYVNRASFAKAMKTAFSYFTVIHQFYSQQ